jgi:hypothetical protein
MIDLSPMRWVWVHPATKRAWAGPGALWGDFDHETQAFGLATTGGIVTHTGVAGLTLGGGIGWLMRKYGATADNLAAADLVTADGQLVRASASHDPELLWGLRGGGGNFGIVTNFEFTLHHVGPTVLAGPVVWAMEDAPEVMRFYADFCADASEELTTIVQYRTLPPFPFFPAKFHGRKVLQIGSVWAGALDEGERALAPLRAFGKPLFDLVGPKQYTANQGANDKAVPHGWHYYWKSADLSELKGDVIDIISEHSLRMQSPRSFSIIFQLGGAVAQFGEDDTAYCIAQPHTTSTGCGCPRRMSASGKSRGRRTCSTRSSPTTTANTSTSSWTKDRSACVRRMAKASTSALSPSRIDSIRRTFSG